MLDEVPQVETLIFELMSIVLGLIHGFLSLRALTSGTGVAGAMSSHAA